MQALIVSTGVVALAEVGDKTQLPAFILAAWFRQPLPIIAGNLCATVINHGMAWPARWAPGSPAPSTRYGCAGCWAI